MAKVKRAVPLPRAGQVWHRVVLDIDDCPVSMAVEAWECTEVREKLWVFRLKARRVRTAKAPEGQEVEAKEKEVLLVERWKGTAAHGLFPRRALALDGVIRDLGERAGGLQVLRSSLLNERRRMPKLGTGRHMRTELPVCLACMGREVHETKDGGLKCPACGLRWYINEEGHG